MAKVTLKFLGVGSAFSMKYGNTSALVTVENNGETKRLLIDCGRTAPDDLHELGHTWADIDAIFITHIHGDHVYGLEHAGFMGRYVLNKKPHIIFPDRKLKNDLWDRVLKGTMMIEGNGKNLNFDDYFTWEAVGKDEPLFFFNGVMFSVYPTLHIKNKKSYGLIIGEEKFVIYSADSLLNKDFLDLAVTDGCQAIFHDCQFAHIEDRVHASLEDLISLRKDIRDLTFIMHYGDNLSEHFLNIKEAGLKITSRGTDYVFDMPSGAEGRLKDLCSMGLI